MNSEKTDKTSKRPVRGWVGFDGACGLCGGGVRRWRAVFERRGFRFVPLQEPWLAGRLGLRPGELPGDMKLLLADGRVVGGVEALIRLGGAVWWLAPFTWMASVPGVRGLLAQGYRRLARNRYAISECLRRKQRATPRRHAAFFEWP